MSLLLRYAIAVLSLYPGTSTRAEGQTAATLQQDTAIFDIAYAHQSGAQKLDVYLPARSKETRLPVIIGIHGGAFLSGDKKEESFIYKNGLKHGYAVVCINYRLSQEALFPAQILDVKTAIRWVKAHAADYNLDTTKIAVWGTSAGGYLAALAGTSGNVRELEDKSMGYAQYNSNVYAVVDWYGPINFLTMDTHNKETGTAPVHGLRHDDPESPESLLMGAPIQQIQEQVLQSNPEQYITKDDPYFYIQHGLADDYVPWKQSEEFAIKLRKIPGNRKVSLHLMEGTGHGTEQFFTEENYTKTFDFLDKVFKRQKR
ncbi:MAG: alpha/beta hydrolase [Chitinophagaceae bacterium]|nr:alpha/beta hydrolase [Chitinophagaceae bacterium]